MATVEATSGIARGVDDDGDEKTAREMEPRLIAGEVTGDMYMGKLLISDIKNKSYAASGTVPFGTRTEY